MAIATMSRARRLAAGGPRGRPRPRGPARRLPQHADHARDRGARPHPLQAGQDPRLVLHGPRQRGRRGRRRHRDGLGGRRHAAPPRHGRPRLARRRALADLRAVHGPRATGRRKGRDGNVHMADSNLGLLAMVSHLPAMLPVAVGCALAFRIREENRVAVGWFGEGASARGDTHEAMNLAGVRKLPGRVRLRQQPVGLLDADLPRVRDRARRRPRRGLRLRGRRRRRQRRARRLPRGQARGREGARRAAARRCSSA